jgi:hypothetical protein
VQLSEIAQLKKQVNLKHLTNRIRFKLGKLFQKRVVRTKIDIYVFIKGLDPNNIIKMNNPLSPQIVKNIKTDHSTWRWKSWWWRGTGTKMLWFK